MPSARLEFVVADACATANYQRRAVEHQIRCKSLEAEGNGDGNDDNGGGGRGGGRGFQVLNV